MRRLALALSLLLATGAWEWLKSPDPDIEAGNKEYDAGNYEAALGLYERSKAGADQKAAVKFDVGAALYKLAQGAEGDDKKQFLERAESAFREATDTKDPALKSAAFHNIGNSMFVRERWKDAIAAYKKALKANQNNDDARYNLELALRKIQRKNQQQQQSQGQGQGQGQQPNNPGNGQQQKPQGQDGNQKDQNDPNGQNQSPQAQGQGQQSQDKQPGQGDDQTNQANPGQGQNQGTPQNPGNQAQPPQPGQGQPQPQPQPGQGQPTQRLPGLGGTPDLDGNDAEGELESGDGESKTDRDRKLDRLENRSRDLRKRRLRRGGASRGSSRFSNPKDW